MRRITMGLVFLFVSAGIAFSQTNQNKLTVDDVYQILDENFGKFEWVHQLLAEKSEDSRTPHVKVTRLAYPITVNRDGVETTESGEIVYIEVIKAGYRYDMKFDFSPKQERGAERSRTVKNRIYGKLLVDVPREQLQAASTQ